MYKLYKNSNGDITGAFKNDAFIPFDPANTDYANYLLWLEEGNTPEPADPVIEPVEVEPSAQELLAQLKALQKQIAKLST